LLLLGLIAAGCATNATKQNMEDGYRALGEQQYDQALAVADKQLQESPRGPGAADAWYLRGRALEGRTTANQADARNNYAAARDAYEQALRFNPAEPLAGRIHSGLGNVSYWLDDYTTAQTEWTAAYDSLTDPATKSYTLYRIGLCQQRLGNFTEADQTFARVQHEFAGTDAAEKAKKHQGFRSFTVQLATYANPKTADSALASLRQQGVTPTKSQDSLGRTIVSVGPAQNYAEAIVLRNRFQAVYPDALILP